MHRIKPDTGYYDYTELRLRIEHEYGYTRFARLMAVSENRLAAILRGEGEFTQSEIIRAAALLCIDPVQISAVFFRRCVQKL